MDETIFFKVETRVRGMIIDLIEPTVRRSTDAVETLAKIAHEIEVIKSKIEDIEIIQTKTVSKLGYLDDYSKRLMEFSANLSFIETKMNRDKQDIAAQYQNIFETTNSLKEEVTVLDHQRCNMRTDITGLSHNIMNTKYDIEQKISAFKDEFRDKLLDLDDRAIRAAVDNEVTLKKLKKFDKEIGEISGKTSILNKQTEEHSLGIKKADSKAEHIRTESTKQFESTRMTLIKVSTECITLQRSLANLQNTIKKNEDYELKRFINLTRGLYDYIPDLSSLKILAQFDLKRLSEIDHNTNEEISSIVKEHLSKAESIMKMLEPPKSRPPSAVPSKKKKRRANSPRKNTIKNSEQDESLKIISAQNIEDYEEIPKITLNKKRTLSIEQILPQKQEEIIEVSSINPVLTLSNKKPPKKKESLKKSSSSSSESEIPEMIDYSPIINALKNELQTEINEKIQFISNTHEVHIKELKDILENYKNNLNLDINELRNDNEEKFNEQNRILHDVELLTNQAVYECNSQLNNRKRENNDFHFELKNIQGKIVEINKKYAGVLDSIEMLSKKIISIIEYSKLTCLLQQQDEADRESIALMGYKDPKVVKPHQRLAKPVISFDKQCMSCTGQSSVVINAFKIACLAYAPSPVAFQGERYSRRELIDLQNKLLESAAPESLDSPLLEKRQAKTASTTMKNYRPVSVPSPQHSPHSDFPDADLPKILRKSINL